MQYRKTTYSDARDLRINSWAFLSPAYGEEKEGQQREYVGQCGVYSVWFVWLIGSPNLVETVHYRYIR
jgi:hypothetical protein